MKTQLTSKGNYETSCGVALILGSFLMTITMVLHPVGGSFEHLINISSVIIVTHTIAIVSLPISLFGYWGLTKKLSAYSISNAAFIFISFGTASLLIAAALNGIALPLLVNHFSDAQPEVINSIKPILSYNTILNQAFDLICIGAASFAIILWSVSILRTRMFPKWMGAFGILTGLLAIVLLISGLYVDLTGFRIFAFCFVCWTVTIGILLKKSARQKI